VFGCRSEEHFCEHLTGVANVTWTKDAAASVTILAPAIIGLQFECQMRPRRRRAGLTSRSQCRGVNIMKTRFTRGAPSGSVKAIPVQKGRAVRLGRQGPASMWDHKNRAGRKYQNTT
jgi:hypothetical protein